MHCKYERITTVSDIKIIDDLLPKGYADAIEEDLIHGKFLWQYIDDVTNKDYGNNSGLAHLAYDMGKGPSDWYPFIKPIVYSIEQATGHKITQLLRIRVGFLYPAVNHMEHNTPHIDFMFPHYTACYYVNDSDGDTVVFNETLGHGQLTDLTEENMREYVSNTKFNTVSTCSPKKNRLCVFDGLRFHSSTKPLKHDRRLVITVNYIV